MLRKYNVQSHLITWGAPRLRHADQAVALTRRIVLVDLYWTRDKDPRVPLGHASLLAALREDPSIEVRSVVLPVNRDVPVEAIVARILGEASGRFDRFVDVGIGAYIWNEDVLQRLLPMLRAKGFTGRIILGGPQVSYVEHGLEKLYPEADLFIRGHAETALLETVRNDRRRDIAGVHYAGAEDRKKQAVAMLDALPSPLLAGLIELEGQHFLRWETRRGCQFKCSFCQHRQVEARTEGQTIPDSRLFREIDLICKANVQELAVLDPVFNTNDAPGHAVRVLNRFVANGYRGRISLQCRAELIDDAFLAVASRLDVCLEFGLQTIHQSEQKAIERTNNMKKVDEVLAKVRKLGIDHEVSLIYGLPEQTLASFGESVGWCLERRIPVIKAFPLLLLRGTKLDVERERWNLVVANTTMPEVVESDTFSRADWSRMQAISQVLHETEGNHPQLTALIERAAMTYPDRSRWQPDSGEAAA